MSKMPGLDKDTLISLAENGLTLKSLKILDKSKKDDDLTIYEFFEALENFVGISSRMCVKFKGKNL